MKLKDLKKGDRFILIRNGEEYIKGREYIDESSPKAKRFFVTPISEKEKRMPKPRTLSCQCLVKLIERFPCDN